MEPSSRQQREILIAQRQVFGSCIPVHRASTSKSCSLTDTTSNFDLITDRDYQEPQVSRFR
ncbi:hypothetical protein GcC1_214015 [Golovinomyces cichoracearum]|uniref:Uncharacterized protein n=1 Tax=Golovinomyces cichoracearum TaxID=62708 RepID=A0A420H9M7_9PEZI|nr:hypothetical protein GcC1_214015 [Golovinomyces cichoracearum]